MKMNCGNCRFSLPNPDEDGMAWCRRMPPLIYLLDKGGPSFGDLPARGTTTGTAFPYVNLEHCWCGEHEPNEKTRRLS